jgi:hypothetical protein
VDIEEFSAAYRNDTIRVRLQASLQGLLTTTFSATGIDEAQFTMDTTGDGWLVTIAPAVGKPRILGPVVDRLAAGLRRRNRRADQAERLRLRLVLHAGDLLSDQVGGFVGDQLNFAFRLLDAQQFRVLLERASGPVVACVSDEVYRQVIAQRHEGLDPAAFEPVWFECKKARALGWVRAPGESGLAGRAGLFAKDVLMT